MSNEALFIILMIVAFGLVLFILPQWRLRRAISQVIRIFREHNAFSIKNAKTNDELGIRQRGITEGMFKIRDYKVHALDVLIRSEIIQMTEDGKLYLLEDKLISSRFYKPQSGFR